MSGTPRRFRDLLQGPHVLDDRVELEVGDRAREGRHHHVVVTGDDLRLRLVDRLAHVVLVHGRGGATLEVHLVAPEAAPGRAGRRRAVGGVAGEAAGGAVELLAPGRVADAFGTLHLAGRT